MAHASPIPLAPWFETSPRLGIRLVVMFASVAFPMKGHTGPGRVTPARAPRGAENYCARKFRDARCANRAVLETFAIPILIRTVGISLA